MERLKYFLKSFSGILFFFIILFIAAGEINYHEGWLYFSLSFFGLILNIVATKNNELMGERSKPGLNAKSWDKKILGGLAILTIISYLVAGLDSGRFNWTTPFDVKITAVGILLMISGQTLFTIAKYQNNFFSSVVRIQMERAQTVCDRGLYRFIRHPGYLGMILSWIGFPIILNSVYSSIPVVIAIVFLIIRTGLEDNLLSKELTGYKEYKKKTKYRLIPLIW